jgi:hypothetical protein
MLMPAALKLFCHYAFIDFHIFSHFLPPLAISDAAIDAAAFATFAAATPFRWFHRRHYAYYAATLIITLRLRRLFFIAADAIRH